MWNKKSPQIVEFRPPMCSQIFFLAGKLNANQLNILVHLQLLWLNSAYQFKVLLHLPPFGRNCNVKLWFDPQFWGLGWSWRGSKIVQIEISSPHFYLTSIHTKGLSCTIWPQYTTRQTDRQTMPIDRLCYSLGGLIQLKQISFGSAKWAELWVGF